MQQRNFTARQRTAGLLIFTLSLIFSAAIWQAGHSSAQKVDSTLTDPTDNQKSDLAPEAATISGRVFQDFNQNGTYDTAAGLNSIDVGVGGVTVSAYDSSGVARGSTTTAASTGLFSLAATGTGPYRVEFTTIPAGYTPSARSTDSMLGGTATNSGSTVQFVNNANTPNVNLALTRAEEFCQDNPTLVTARYAQGGADGVYAANNALWDFPYNSGTTYTDTTVANYDNPTTHTMTVTVGQIGTVNSLAYNRSTNRLYAASYFKRHAGFGPGADNIFNNADDPGAIYVINPTTSTVTNVFTVPGATTNSHNTTDYNTDNNDTGWNGTGKRSLGGMALADDNSRLFVMNLENRQLYALNPTTGASLGNSVTPDTLTMNTPGGTASACATGGDRRPFAVRFYRGSVYIGVICTGQSTANVNDLFAYIFQVNPTTLAITTTPVWSQALNYTRGFADPSWTAAWQPWVATIPAGFAYAQPMFTDMDFDDGNLIVALRDRTGDAANDINKRTAGDTIRACGSFGAWTTESNGRCGGNGSAPQNTGQGPGNGEFYHQDDFCLTPNGANYHDEVTWGSVMQIPGRQGVLATLLDPINRTINDATFDGGFRIFNKTTGGADRAYRIYNGIGGSGQPDFGKTNGLSDVVPLCNSAPIEIGNRVWRDTNANGVQDPGEPGIANVAVRLYQGGVPVNYNCTTYADNFPAIAYNGSTGTGSWTSTPWAEIADDAGVTTGGVRVVLDGSFSNAIRLNRASRGISRAVSLASSGSATLSFEYRRQNSLGATVEYFNGTSWVVLQTYGSGTDAAYTSASFTLPLTATSIRFMNGASNGNGNQFFVDNVVVTSCSNEVITDANGEYYFTGMSPSTAYSVRLDRASDYNAGGPLSGLHRTILDQTSQLGDDDSSDSDADSYLNPAGSPAGTWAGINLTTGTAGSNNHTYDFGFVLAPSASNVNLEGRVVTANGNGIRNIFVVLTEQDGTVRYTLTSSFGYYRFTDITAGQSVVISLSSKRFTFSPESRLVTLEDDVAGLDWIANE